MTREHDRSLTVRREQPRGTRVIALGGEHGWAEAALLKHETREAWPGAKHVIVDFSAATFVDSSVINWLLRLNATPGRAFALSIVEGEPGSFVGRLFSTMGLREVFACHATREQVPSEPRVAPTDIPNAATHSIGPLRAHWVERAGPAHELARAGSELGRTSTETHPED